MTTKAITPFLLWILLTSTFAAQAGGPWTRPKGGGYAQIGVTYIGYSTLFDGNGDIVNLRRKVTDFTTQGYLEYGITNKLTGIAIVPFKYVTTGDEVLESDYFNDASKFSDTLLPSGSLFGPGNIKLGLRYNFINKKYIFSGELNAEYGYVSYDCATALRTGYDAWVIEPQLSFGRGWNKVYFFAEGSFRYRTNNHSNELNGAVEIGYKFIKSRTWIAFRSEGRKSLKDGSFDNNNNRLLHTGLTPNNQEYVGYGIKVAQPIGNHFAINLGLFGGMGHWVAATPSINFGISYQWEKKQEVEQPQNN